MLFLLAYFDCLCLLFLMIIRLNIKSLLYLIFLLYFLNWFWTWNLLRRIDTTLMSQIMVNF